MAQMVFGNWEYEGDTDWFSVELIAGVSYQLSIEASNGFVYRVADPSRPGLAEIEYLYEGAPGPSALSLQGFAYSDVGDDEGVSANEPGHFTALESGTYWFSATGMGAGSYSVKLAEVADDFADNIASTSVITVGGSVTGRAELASDADFHRVTLAANQAVAFAVSGNDDQIEVMVVDAAGNVLDASEDNESGVFVAPEAGDYFFVTVADSNPLYFEPTGYRLSLSAAQVDDFGPTPGTAGTLVLTEGANGLLGGSLVGNLDYEDGDRDLITIDLVKGQTYQFRLSGNIFAAGDAAAAMYVYDDTHGAFTAYGSNGATGITTLFAEVSGTHYIEINGDYGVGAYNLDVTQIVDDYSASPDRPGALTVGVTGSGTFNSNRDSDWFAVQLTAGASYSLTASAAGTAFRPTNLTFYSPDEVQLGSAFTAETSGTYYARVLGATSIFPINLANYTFTVNAYVDDYADNISTTGRLRVGGTVSGRVEVNGDSDWFAINLIAGQTYRIVQDNGFGNVETALHSATGELIAYNIYDADFNSLGDLIFTASESGTYYLATTTFGSSYILSATLVSDDYVDFAAQAGSFLDAPFYDGRGKTAVGDEGADRFLGKLRDDLLRGLGGDDTLIGGGGDDILDGGTGVDRMAGNAGNDTYVVDDARDRVSEDAAGGIDTVYASVNYRLGANVENLVLTGAALTARGNDASNTIRGNGGDNAVSGLAGDDVLHGMAGDDRLDGGVGIDTLWGGAGRDVLTGGAGADLFAFASGDGGGAAGSDTIADFSKADGDRIDLSSIDAPLSFVGTAGYSGEAGEVWTQVKGSVTFVRIDLDGDRVDDLTIRVNDVTTLSAADFVF